MTVNYLKPVFSIHRNRALAICGFVLLISAPLILSAGALPTAADLGLGADTKPAEGLTKYIAWGVKILAYAMMVASLVGAGFYSLQAFGASQEKKGGMGAFFGVLVSSIVMVAIVVSLGLIAVKWADGLATIQVTSIHNPSFSRVAGLSDAHVPMLRNSDHA